MKAGTENTVMRQNNITVCTVLAAAIASLFLPHAARAVDWPQDRPMTLGHRGTTVLADENTIPAYSLAWQYGVDMIECDPKLTADKVYVIMHDDTVDRTTDGSGRVEDLTLDQIKDLKTDSGLAPPTLEQVLVFAREHGLMVYLDVKDPPPDKGELLVSTIEEAGMTDRVIVGCWQLKTLRMINRQNPEIATLISWPYPAPTMGLAKIMGADCVGTLRGLVTKPAILLAKKMGLHVFTMPINSEEEIDKFLEKGLDGLQSDDPRLLEPHGRGRQGE